MDFVLVGSQKEFDREDWEIKNKEKMDSYYTEYILESSKKSLETKIIHFVLDWKRKNKYKKCTLFLIKEKFKLGFLETKNIVEKLESQGKINLYPDKNEKFSDEEKRDRQKQYNRNYKKNNKDRIKKYGKKHYEENRDKIREYAKKYQEENKDKIREYHKKNYVINKEKAKKRYNDNINKIREYQKKYREKNKDKILVYCNEYRKTRRKEDIGYRILLNLRARLHKALEGKFKETTTRDFIGCSIPELKEHLEKQFKGEMSWENYGYKGWHIDHIKPCSWFDLTKPEEQRKCFHYTNLQPLWCTENLSKNHRYEG